MNGMRKVSKYIAVNPMYCPFATENLLENTGGVGAPHQWSLGAAACYLLCMLTRVILMPSLFHRPSYLRV